MTCPAEVRARDADLLSRDPDAFLRGYKTLAGFFTARAGLLPGESTEEVYADALVGLWDATRRWDPARSAFSTFAGRRIIGAITDGRRARDPLTRTQRTQQVDRPVSLNALTGDPDADWLLPTYDPIADWHDTHDIREVLHAAIDTLPANQRHVVVETLTGRTYATIAADLGVSEARVCQIRSAAIDTLRAALTAA